MLYLRAKLLDANEMEARGAFPPGCLLTVFDPTTRQTLSLMAPHECLELVKPLDDLTELLLTLKWRQVDLAALGGSGRGKAYRLSVASAEVAR